MSSEHLASAQNELKGNLGGAWNILDGAQGQYQDLGVARRFGGSAAAYSLRDIGAMNGRVVNVRREPHDDDNPGVTDETDFSANQVQSGVLEDWVNGKLEDTLPADVATAAAAYSLRKVKATYSGNAVRIRRSSDDIEVDVAFDSDDKVSASSAITDVAEQGGEIGSTTATDLNGFLNETLTLGVAVEGGSGGSRPDSFSNATESSFTATVTATAGGYFPYKSAGGDAVTVSFDLVLSGGASPSINTSLGVDTVATRAAGAAYSSSGSYTFTLNCNAEADHIRFADSDDGTFAVTNFRVVSHTHQAFVHTWYDQAGSNDATQETAANQPKIASSGALLADENGFPEIQFTPDASNGKFLSFTTINFSDTMGIFFKSIFRNSGGSSRTLSKDGSFTHIVQFLNAATVQINTTTDATFAVPNFTTSSKLHTILTASDSANYFGNAATADSPQSVNMNSDFQLNQIGVAANSSGSARADFDTSELMFYTSDQSANRFKIESNINNYYGLYNDANDLAGNFTVDSSGSGTNASISNESKTEFTATVVDKAGFFGADLNEAVPNGSNLYISFIANLSPSGGTAATPNFGLADSSDKSGNSTGNPLDTAVTEGFNSITVAGTSSTCDRIRFTEGNDNVSFVISDLKVSRIARNGFVETWYDQSANIRDAIQGTATNQPSIVQNGGIVKVNSKPAITFDGNDNFLEVDGTGSAVAYSFSPSGDMGMFIVSKQSTGNVIDSRDAGSDGIFLQQASSNTTRFRYNGDGSIDITATRDAQHFSTMTLDSTTLLASVDGGTAGTDTVTAGISTTHNLVLGAGFNDTNFTDGEIQEAIFYENNKTSDKSDIETDIDNFYSIK